MADTDASPSLSVRLRPVRGVIAGLGALSLIVCGVASLSIAIEIALGNPEPTAILVMGGVGLYFLFFGILLLWLMIDLFRLPAPLIMIGPEGVFDRRLSAEPIPWDRLSWRRTWLFGFGGAVQLDTDFPLKPRLPQRALALLNRLCRYPAWNIVAFCTDADAKGIARVMEHFSPRGGREG
ncbi:MAG: hypothetical protein QM627_08130 [Luteolibacter sp.]